jgi:tRNA G46 methylase TrmB
MSKQEEEKEDHFPKDENTDILKIKNSYNSKKPTWWKRVAGRRGSKSQRRSILNMTEAGYVIPTKIGKLDHELSMSKLFQSDVLGTPLQANDILIPKSSCSNPPDFQGIVNLELGFGLGDNLLTLAMKYPQQYYLGAEIHSPGVGTALGRMEEALKSNSYWMEQSWFDTDHKERILSNQTNIPNQKPYDNLRIFPGDGVKLLSSLPDQSIDAIYVTFPDPFPKESDVDFRLIQEETLSSFARILKRGGCFYLATDAPSFDEWTMQIFNRVMMKHNPNHLEDHKTGWQVVMPCPDRNLWLPVVSKYEEKGIHEGRRTMCRCWRYV